MTLDSGCRSLSCLKNSKKAGGNELDYQIGDIVRTKKQHPCGSKLWEITRVGVDFKLKCQGCGHVVMLPREKALKAITKKISNQTTKNDI